MQNATNKAICCVLIFLVVLAIIIQYVNDF